MRELGSWVSKINDSSFEDRTAELNAVLSNFGSISEEAANIAKVIAENREFQKLSYLTHLHYIPKKERYPETLRLFSFKSPVVAVKHKKLPLILAVAEDFPEKGFIEDFPAVKSRFAVKQSLGWARAVSHMNESEKKDLENLIIEGIESYRKTLSSGQQWLSDFIRAGKDFSVMGFAINIPYINVERKFGPTDTLWVHAWATPQLLLRHRTLPAIMIVGPSIRLDENIFGDRSMEGYTG